MTEATTVVDPQAGTTPEPQAGTQTGQEPTVPATPTPQEGGQGQEPEEPSTQPRTPEEYEAEIKRLRSEAAKNRKAASDFEGKLKAKEDAELSEQERLTKKATELETERTQLLATIKEDRLEAAVKMKARDLSIIDPDAAFLLLDKTAIEYDDNDKPDVKSVERALAALVAQRTYLVGQSGGTGPAVANPSRPVSGQTFTKAQIEDRAFYEANRDAIMVALQEGRITD